MAYHFARLLLRDRNLINKELLPRILAGASVTYDKAAFLGTAPQLQSSATGANWAIAAVGALGAAAAIGFTAAAEPETPPALASVKSSYAAPERLHGIPKEIILYQYEVCPFCCKVKAFLDYHKIPYRTVEVSPLTKKQLKWSNYRKVPVALLDGELVADSTAIITRLAAEVAEQKQQQAAKGQAPLSGWWKLVGMGNRKQKASFHSAAVNSSSETDEMRWRRWVDERLVRLLTVNIYRNARESFQTFDYITESSCNFGFFEREAARVVGAIMMWGISGRLRKKYGIEGDVRAELNKAADTWVDALGDQRFHGGAEPDLADLSVFGVIRSITCTDTFMDLMHNSRIGAWYAHMMAAVGDSSRLSAT